METVTARLPDEMIAKLELITKEEHIDRSEMIRRTLDVGIQQFLLERALKAYREKSLTVESGVDGWSSFASHDCYR
ncbi:MAG: ribbon-helix-helix domain-containing protein [Candidatus Thorarchaeota archaeon]